MKKAGILAAIAVPLFYLFAYTPLGMDTTDFGYFYAYAWRILEGQTPYRDFFYIKPALPLYWHALWMWLSPEKWQILAGKAGFLMEMLGASWLGALYLGKLFDPARTRLPTPLLATAAFVFSVHSFPHMPWHTADGALFCALALFLAAIGQPLASGAAAACAVLCKQSFGLVPLGILALLIVRQRRACLPFLAGLALVLAAFAFWLHHNGAWHAFREMTTGQLDIREAIEAGLLIYLRQNWLPPLLALIPWAGAKFLKKPLPAFCAPAYCYLIILCAWHCAWAFTEKTWIGFGLSWPTLFMLLGCACVLWPRRLLAPYLAWPEAPRPLLTASAGLGCALLVAWSCAISGGYKIPAFFSAPLLFSFFTIHAAFFKPSQRLAWAALVAGLAMFWAAYQYPYVFPQRPLAAADLIHDAGTVYPKASGVKVDADMLARLEELKELRQKYGANYKTLPGFTLAYYLNGDRPMASSDWLIDWEINGKTDQLYNELLEKNLTVFMERDQLDQAKADNYARAGYTVPQMVRKNWRLVEETPHFVVFQPPVK